MGCPILLGFAEKAKEISKTWASAIAVREDYPPDMLQEALRTRSPFKDTLERRAHAALGIIVFEVLRNALHCSRMQDNVTWLKDVPASLEYEATAVVLKRLKERVIAWKMDSDFLQDGKLRTEAELEMIFIERVWEILVIADELVHDMSHGSYVVAGTALAHAMAANKCEVPHWLRAFEVLKGTE